MKLTQGRSAKLFGNVAILAVAHFAAPVALSQELEIVVVTATRVPQSAFDLPVSISSVDGRIIQSARQEVNLSESLIRVPGVVAQNRQNYAQDLQVSIRGFGARSSFGVRGVRLYADGIPATMPDGQGQVSNFDLGSAGGIEVLRGPFSVLYGNSSGGVIALFTEEGQPGATITGTASAGSFGAQRLALKVAGDQQNTNYVVALSRFDTEGYRDHSAARRDTGNARIRYEFSDRSRLSLIANALDMQADDPLGLTQIQWQTNPQQASANATTYNTRKSVGQQQLGLNYELNWNDANLMSAMVYGGHRTAVQYLSIPFTVQAPATHSGGVIDLERNYVGSDAHWTHSTTLAGEPAQITVGISYDQLSEDRKGYQNFIGSQLGVRGELRRDEDNTVSNIDQYLQMQWRPSEQWLLLAGIRNSEVKFQSDDRYVVPGNGLDSGQRTYHATTPAAGVTYSATEKLNVYAAYGQGFETPTFNELAYRSTDGTQTGLNLGLAAARSKHYELGLKTKLADAVTLNTAVFRADTRNELAVLASSGGRAVYQNVARTRRDGAELELSGSLENGFSTALSYTWLQARYAAGNRIPGIPASSAYTELAWQHPASGLSIALEARYASAVFAEDSNNFRAPGQVVANVSLGLEQTTQRWRFQEYLRVDNLADRKFVGSVIVNDANQRYFEPTPGRTWLLGIKGSLKL
ncbi:MAG: TonB-dependent receptor family protein [Steroidobacteraceae bacterium]